MRETSNNNHCNHWRNWNAERSFGRVRNIVQMEGWKQRADLSLLGRRGCGWLQPFVHCTSLDTEAAAAKNEKVLLSNRIIHSRMVIRATPTMFFQPTINCIQFIPSWSDMYPLPILRQSTQPSTPEDAAELYTVVGAGDDAKQSAWVPQKGRFLAIVATMVFRVSRWGASVRICALYFFGKIVRRRCRH